MKNKQTEDPEILKLEQQVEAQLQDCKDPVEFVNSYTNNVTVDVSITPKHVFIDETIYVPGMN